MIRPSLLTVLLCLWASLATATDTLRLAVTTSFQNSGLSDVLLPAIRDALDLEVRLIVVGTGQALRLGRAGDVDAVLVHAPSAEAAFVAEGAATHRRPIMYNDFVLIGPAPDPAGIQTATDARAALRRIHTAQSPFVSRGDDSGTHRRERALWAEMALDPDTFGRWYMEVGAGMGAALNTAQGLAAYILADRGSWLNFGNRDGLALLFEGDPALFNQYSFLPINAARHPHVKSAAAARLEDWLTSQAAADLINTFDIAGQRPFVFNARPVGH